MEKMKIGVYVFSDMIKARNTKAKDRFFDGQDYVGLRYILSEIDTPAEISYVSSETINSVDYCLVTLTSYYDVLNLIHELYGKRITAKIICGGPGYNNVGLLRDFVDVGTVGRGECAINRILRGEPVDGLYYKADNYDLHKPIRIRGLETYIHIHNNLVGDYHEKSLGCQRKCYFCEYSWKHKWTAQQSGYHSGLLNRETLLQDVDWSSYRNADLVSAIDGATEQTRRIINKPILNADITSKMLEIYGEGGKSYQSLKLYCLLGYPFETRFEPEEAVESIIAARKPGSDRRLSVVVVSPHFMPMPFTPMECEPLNWINFRDKIRAYDFERFGTGNIKVFWPYRYASSPINAAEATILNRADADSVPMIAKVLCSSKYKSAEANVKRATLEKYFGYFLGRVDSVLPYIVRNNPTDGAKRAYLERVAALCVENHAETPAF